jgi:hypothetical protein
MNFDKYFAVAGRWLGRIADSKVIDRAVIVEEYCFHENIRI